MRLSCCLGDSSSKWVVKHVSFILPCRNRTSKIRRKKFVKLSTVIPPPWSTVQNKTIRSLKSRKPLLPYLLNLADNGDFPPTVPNGLRPSRASAAILLLARCQENLVSSLTDLDIVVVDLNLRCTKLVYCITQWTMCLWKHRDTTSHSDPLHSTASSMWTHSSRKRRLSKLSKQHKLLMNSRTLCIRVEEICE